MNIAKEIIFYEIYFIKHDFPRYITVTIIKLTYDYSLYIAQPLAGERKNDILENLRKLHCVICNSDCVVANLMLGPSSDWLTCSDMQSIDQ